MKRLFAILDCESPLNFYNAGYFEKVLGMMFRKMTTPTMAFLNNNGMEKLQAFLRHIDNYSMMQIVQRLMLPHIPFTVIENEDDETPNAPPVVPESTCHWSHMDQVSMVLCHKMLLLADDGSPLELTENENVENFHVVGATHVSDLLITVLQLSPAELPMLTDLCSVDCLTMLFNAAVNVSIEANSFVQATSMSALTVLESIISRLCEAESMFGVASDSATFDAAEKAHREQIDALIQENIIRVCEIALPMMDPIATELNSFNRPAVAGQRPTLGQRGLQLVKLLETIVRLGVCRYCRSLTATELNMEMGIRNSHAIKIIWELCFIFTTNSLLHLSMHRLILLILESCISRYVGLGFFLRCAVCVSDACMY